MLKVVGSQPGWQQVEFQDPEWGVRTGWVKADLIAVVRRPLGGSQTPTSTTRPPLPAPPPPPTPVPTKPRVGEKLKDVKIRGYVTSVTSPTEFEIEDYRITKDQAFVLEFENASPERLWVPVRAPTSWTGTHM